MMILPKTDLDFDKLAQEVADRFFTGDLPLTAGVAKTATRLQLNPEQTRRLVEKTNTFATVRMLKTAQDRKAEFELANTDKVLEQTHFKEVGTGEKTASLKGDIPIQLPNRRTNPKLNKVALPSLQKTAGEKPENPLLGIFKAEKTLSETKQKKLAAELKVQDRLDFLISEFSKYRGPDFPKFASEAATLYGEQAESVLTKIAEYLGEDDSFEKVAYVVNDQNPLLEKLADALDGLQQIVSLGAEIEEARETLEKNWSTAKNGAHKDR